LKLTHLIVAAEGFEAPHDHAAHGHEAWAPSDGIERFLFTLLANLVIGSGFGLLLSAAFALRHAYAGEPIDAVRGVVWGIGGFVAFALAPALGLPPELPGSAAAELVARQGWWIATALATAAGLALLAFARAPLWKVVGVLAVVLPHVIGAPESPHDGHGTAPAELSAAFAAASLAAAAVFWAVLGGVGGWVFARLGRA